MSSIASTTTLCLFTRYPTPGQTKTRLIPALGSEGAAQLHDALTRHTLRTALALQERNPSLAVEIHHCGEDQATMEGWLGNGLSYISQSEGDLGVRMHQTFVQASARGARKAVIIGTDAPDLTVEDLENAFALLESAQAVIGPATDGGYYLIGLGKPTPELFVDIPWGSHEVWTKTEEILLKTSVPYARLRCQFDIDRPVDLDRLREYPRLADQVKRLSLGQTQTL
jgi:hypothetical protein